MLNLHKIILIFFFFNSQIFAINEKQEISKPAVKTKVTTTKNSKKAKTQKVSHKTNKVSLEKKNENHSNDQCFIPIIGTDRMQFVDTQDKVLKQIVVPKSCKEFVLKFSYKGKMSSSIMGHNIIITEEAHKEKVSENALKQGRKNNYLPSQETSKLIIAASTKTLGGSEQDFQKEDIIVDMSKVDVDKKYVFFCSFPGHSLIMKGSFIKEKSSKKQTTITSSTKPPKTKSKVN